MPCPATNMERPSEAEVKDLRATIRLARHYYYDVAAPIFEDGLFDALWNRLVMIESTFPDLDDEDSPTHKVHQPYGLY